MAVGGAGAARRLRRRGLRAAEGAGKWGGGPQRPGGRPLCAPPRTAARGPSPASPWGQAPAWRGLTGPSPSSLSLQVADDLVKVQVALSNIAGKRERIKILFKKSERPPGGLGELEKLLL